MIWLSENWKYIACVVLGLVLGLFIPKGKGAQVEVKASQAQSGSIETASHIVIKPREHQPTVAGCPPCPQLPEITVDCGGKASGSQGQAITATASIRSPVLGLWLGLGSTQNGQLDGSCMVSYGSWGLLGSYSQNNALSAKVLFKALEF